MASRDYRQKCIEAKGKECAECKTTEDIVVHHIDGDRSNDELENLIPLCEQHHSEVHNDGLESLGLPVPYPVEGRDPKKMVSFTFRLEQGRKYKLERIAENEGADTSTVFRRMLQQGMEKETVDEAKLNQKIDRLEREKAELEKWVAFLTERVDKLTGLVTKAVS